MFLLRKNNYDVFDHDCTVWRQVLKLFFVAGWCVLTVAGGRWPKTKLAWRAARAPYLRRESYSAHAFAALTPNTLWTNNPIVFTISLK